MNSTPPIPPGPAPELKAILPRSVPHHTIAVPPVKIPMVTETMGAVPMAEVEALQLLAGIPIPAHLGPNVDTAA